MYMEIPPNEPEQQVHQDGDLGMELIIYLCL